MADQEAKNHHHHQNPTKAHTPPPRKSISCLLPSPQPPKLPKSPISKSHQTEAPDSSAIPARPKSILCLLSSPLWLLPKTFYAKQTQFPKPRNQPNPLPQKELHKNNHPPTPKKQTQNKPNPQYAIRSTLHATQSPAHPKSIFRLLPFAFSLFTFYFSTLCLLSNSFYAKQTQSQKHQNQPNPLSQKGLQRLSPPRKPKKQTQNKPNQTQSPHPNQQNKPNPNPIYFIPRPSSLVSRLHPRPPKSPFPLPKPPTPIRISRNG